MRKENLIQVGHCSEISCVCQHDKKQFQRGNGEKRVTGTSNSFNTITSSSDAKFLKRMPICLM